MGTASVRLAFDLVNFSTGDMPDSTIYLHRVMVDRIDPMALRFENSISWSFENEQEEQWTWTDIPDLYTSPGHARIPGALTITGVDSQTYGSWETPPDVASPRPLSGRW